MAKNIGHYGPSHPHAGKLVEKISRPVVRATGAALKFYDNKSRYAMLKGQEMRELLSRGKSVYLVGIGPSGHNSTAALAEVSAKDGIRPIFNNEEERYTGIRHEDRFPENSLREVLGLLEKMGGEPPDVLAVVGSWDYLAGISTGFRVAAEEAPVSLNLARRSASPQMNLWHFLEALKAPDQLKSFFSRRGYQSLVCVTTTTTLTFRMQCRHLLGVRNRP